MPNARATITFPVAIQWRGADNLEQSHWLLLIMQLIETKLMQILRFMLGNVYSVVANVSFSMEAPSQVGRSPLP